MKRKYTIYSLIGIAASVIMMSGTLNQSGPGAGYTHGPGESNCTSCHAGTLVTSGSNWSNIRLTGNFPSGGYVPDSVYQIEITYRQSGISKFGFQVMPLMKSNNAPAGSISVSSNRVQRYTRNVSGQTREYAGHTNTGTSSVATDSTRWFFEWKAPASNVGDVSFYVVVMATNNNNNNSGDVVYARTFDVPVNTSIPTAVIQGSDTVVCTNGTLSFQGSGANNPTQYNWTFTGAQQSSSTQQNPNVRFTSAGIQNVILTTSNAIGTSKPDTFKVRVLQSPAASIPGSSIRVGCLGDSIALVANQVANCRYTWIPTQETTRQIWAKSSGNYLVTVTDTLSGCASNSNQVSVLFNAAPQTPILSTRSGLSAYCTTAMDTLVATTNAADTFIWYLPSQTVKTTQNTLPFTLSNSAQIVVEAKRQPNCVASSSPFSVTVSNPPIPVVSVESVTTEKVNLIWNSTGSRYAVSTDSLQSFSPWSNDTSFTMSNLQPNTQYLVYIKAERSAPCKDTIQSILVTTAPCSAIEFTISANNNLCLGDTFSIVINGLSNANYGVAFNNSTFSKDTLFAILPTQSGNVRVDIIDSAVLSCPIITRMVNYNLTTPLTVEEVIPAEIKLCSNAEKEFSFTLNYDSLWFIRSQQIVQRGVQKNYIYTNGVEGEKLKAVVFNGACKQESTEGIIRITTAPDPGFSFIRDHKTYTFIPNDTLASTYKWTWGTEGESTEKYPVKTFETMNRNINVKLSVSKEEICFDSTIQNIVLPDVTSVQSIEKAKVWVGPNPFEEVIIITQTPSLFDSYSLYSLSGQLIQTGNLSGEETQLQIEKLESGLYILRMRNNMTGKQQIVKMQKQ